MSLFSAFAVYFIIWWITLFAILPIGLRTQADERDVTLGTTESAPATFNIGRKALLTTIVAGAVFGAYYGLTYGLGLSLDSIPRIVPEFD